MNKISLFGAGFIGGWYARMYSDEVYVEDKYEPVFENPDILNFISTVHNYHPKDGNPYIDIETNLEIFVSLLDHGRRKFGNDLVFNQISTWFVYGTTELPAKETSPCNPTGFYSITARAREQLLISYCETFGLKYRILRLGNVIGVGDGKISLKKNALQHFIRELAQGRDITRYKHGSIRDYIDVRDCVEAIHLVLERGELNQIYNIANGKGLNVKDLIDIAWRESGFKSKIDEIDVPGFHSTVQTSKMYLDNRKLKSLGYVQRYDIKQTIRELINFYKNEQKQNS